MTDNKLTKNISEAYKKAQGKLLMSIIGMKVMMSHLKISLRRYQVVKIHCTILFVILLCFLISPFWESAAAQTPDLIQIASLDVSLYPEFNRPSMLVRCELHLDEATALPAQITLQIPVDAQSLTVNSLDDQGNPIRLENDAADIGLWKAVQFTSITRVIQVEYYDPNLVKEGDQRIFDYEWLSIYPVDSLRITIRQPFGGSDIRSQPALDEKFDGPGNIEYYTGALGPVPAGNLFTLSLMYIKNTSDPAYPALDVVPAVGVNEMTPGKTPSPLSVVLWLLSFAVAVLFLVGVYFLWFHHKTRENETRLVTGVGIRNPEKQMVFCHECGKRSSPGDIFCSNCGTELRRPEAFQKTLDAQEED